MTRDLNGVPFNAKFAEEDKRGRKLFDRPGTDGFVFDSKPIAEVYKSCHNYLDKTRI